MISPGGTIGVLGGGQLGRMFAQAALRLGYRVHVFEPAGPCPAGASAHVEVNRPYADGDALRAFAADVDVLTYEFENVPAAPLEELAGLTRLHPGPSVLHVCQNRLREKNWLKDNGLPHARFVEALGGDIAAAVAEIGLPAVVKTADFGYDGKGQTALRSEADVEGAARAFAGVRCVVEQWVSFRTELSVVTARTEDGVQRSFPAVENLHARHILDYSLAPGRFDATVGDEARALAEKVSARLGVVGLLAVEMFLAEDGEVLINELAPRPHNSGHFSIDACPVSQFEQHVRAVCGLPLGDPNPREPAVMANLLGDLWSVGEPDWRDILAEPGAHLHLYGKAEPRPGRKMGHFTVTGPDLETAFQRARELRSALEK